MTVRTIALAGPGVIGSGWAVRVLAAGAAAAVAAIGVAHASMPAPPEAGRRMAIGTRN